MVITKIFFLFRTTAFLCCVIFLLPGEISQNLMRKPKANKTILQPLLPEMLYGVCWNLFSSTLLLFIHLSLPFSLKKSQLPITWLGIKPQPTVILAMNHASIISWNFALHFSPLRLVRFGLQDQAKTMGDPSSLTKPPLYYLSQECLRYVRKAALSKMIFGSPHLSLEASVKSTCKHHHRYLSVEKYLGDVPAECLK